MKKFYVVGNKVSQSLSPTIFRYWFKKYKIKAQYEYLELNNKNFNKQINELLIKKNLGGLNITIPFKKKIIKKIQQLDKHAKNINAVNCVTIGSKVVGSNTDWEGYYKTLPKKTSLKKKKIILIGYGGAALAIHYVLKLKGFKKIVVINRSKKKLNFEKNKYTISMERLGDHLHNSHLIINTVPINPIKPEWKILVNKSALISDIVYKPKETKFLKAFPDNKKIYGISMLLQQAVPCFKKWFGFIPTIDKKLIQILDKKLND